jgi:hypothetical protein
LSSDQEQEPTTLNDLFTVGNGPDDEPEETTPAKEAKAKAAEEEPQADDAEDTPSAKKKAEEKPSAKKEPEEKPTRRKYKVAGEEREFSDEEIQQWLNERELASHSKRRLTEAAEKEKEAQFILSRVLEDPISAFIELEAGRTGDEQKAVEAALKKAEAFYEQVLKLQGATTEEREKIESERQLKAERAKNARLEKERQEAIEAKEWDALEEEFLGEFEKAGASNDPFTLRFLQEAYQEAIEADQPITSRQAVRRAMEIQRAFEDALLERLTPEQLRKRAPGKAKELREHELKEFKAAQQTRPQSTTSGPRPKAAPSVPGRRLPKAMSMADLELEVGRAT